MFCNFSPWILFAKKASQSLVPENFITRVALAFLSVLGTSLESLKYLEDSEGPLNVIAEFWRKWVEWYYKTKNGIFVKIRSVREKIEM